MNPTVQENFALTKMVEGETPYEYNGLDVDADEFCETDSYGMWCKLSPKATNDRIIKMFNSMLVFIPQTHQHLVSVLHSFGIDADDKPIQTIGWKYMLPVKQATKTIKLQPEYLVKAQIELDIEDTSDEVIQLAIQMQNDAEAANAD